MSSLLTRLYDASQTRKGQVAQSLIGRTKSRESQPIQLPQVAAADVATQQLQAAAGGRRPSLLEMLLARRR